MPNDSTPALPKGLRSAVRDAQEALAAVLAEQDSDARESLAEAARKLDVAMRIAMRTTSRSRDLLSGNNTIAEGIGHNVRVLREEAGWTRAQFASCMEKFRWTRVTVAEVEFDLDRVDGNSPKRRRLTWEELVWIAGLFGVPVVSILVPPTTADDTWYETGHDSDPIREDTLRDLILGDGARVGSGGPQWMPALELTSEIDIRPAPDLWSNRVKRRR